MPISVKDFDRFTAGTRKNPYKCSHCNSQNIPSTLTGATENEAGEFLIRPVGTDGYHSFYGEVCVNCGRTDFFHESRIAAWLSKNSKGG